MSSNKTLKNFIKESLSEKWLCIDHDDILTKAKQSALNPEDVPKIETLHQNIAHMTIALKELETRMIRVINKMNRLEISDNDEFILPLVDSVSIIKAMIKETNNSLNKYYQQ